MKKDRSQPSSRRKTHRELLRLSGTSHTGTLHIIGTPIGHPDDLSLRAIKVLSHVDLVAAENPATTSRLMAHHGISGVLTSYGPMGLSQKVAILIDRLVKGQDIALVVDCGMPSIHDPGSLLVARAREAQIPVATIPGPSIATAALASTGFSADCFVFAGTLPGTPKSLKRFLRVYRKDPRSLIFLADRKGLSGTVRSFGNLFGSRPLALIADLTEPGEVVWIGTGRSILPRINELPRRAEITLVLEATTRLGASRSPRSDGVPTRPRAGG